MNIGGDGIPERQTILKGTPLFQVRAFLPLKTYNTGAGFMIGRPVCSDPRSSSKMHICGYFLGVFYYAILPFVFLQFHICDGFDEIANRQDVKTFTFAPNDERWFFINELRHLLLYMFLSGACVCAQIQQHKHHKILSAQTRHTEGINERKISYCAPRGEWFEYISCPHYLAEILIYICFWALSYQNLNFRLNCRQSQIVAYFSSSSK